MKPRTLKSHRSVKSYYNKESARLLIPLLDSIIVKEKNKTLPNGGIKLPVSAFGKYRITTVRQKIFQGWEWLADNHENTAYKELRSRFTIFMRSGGIYIQPTLNVAFEDVNVNNGTVDIISNLKILDDWLEDETPEQLVLAVSDTSTQELEASVAGLSNIKMVVQDGYVTFTRV